MFGLGKLVGGILDSIGLGKLAPFIAIGIDFFTGNYAALVGDVTDLVSRFTDLSFLDKIAQFAPLGEFGTGGCFGLDSVLSMDRLSELTDRFSSLSTGEMLGVWEKAGKALDLYNEVAQNRLVVNTTRANLATNFRLGG